MRAVHIGRAPTPGCRTKEQAHEEIRNTKLAGLVAGAALSVGAVGLIGSPASADQPIEFSDSVTFPAVNFDQGVP